ncbi:ROK family protein [Oscillospiraceae bacterium PP1C4]
MSYYVCIDIGGTSIKHSIVENDRMIESGQCDTEAFLGGQQVVNNVLRVIEQYSQCRHLEGICISTTGMVDVETGTIIYAGVQMPDYMGINLRKEIQAVYNIPCEVENDVNCAGLAEAMEGAAAGCSSSVCITVGTGVGSCFIADNKVLHGFSGSAGEIGYMHLGEGTFQELASASVLVSRVSRQLGRTVDGYEIFKMARSGNTVCRDEIDRLLKYLSKGIANICYSFNPQVVVLGGGIMNEEDYIYNRLDTHLRENLLGYIYHNTTVTFAKSKNKAGMIGALYHFKQRQNLL